ncbi:MAG: hypothetical protein Q7T48_18660 [Cellvibrio sp.]|uniref:hypothetical protein n=1 Tax=Cellvibrio sp. TaxID=1965322 RepID=UPI00271C3830|nr:hypothetical protein [Cellvibrio sp.]
MRNNLKVATGAHDHNAAGHFALAVQLRNAPAHFRPELDMGNIGEPNGDLID